MQHERNMETTYDIIFPTHAQHKPWRSLDDEIFQTSTQQQNKQNFFPYLLFIDFFSYFSQIACQRLVTFSLRCI